jgi:GTPase SAR1 family protein/class 3 adenylate cyclase
MNSHIEKALNSLQKANYAGYFEEMDKIEMPIHLKVPYYTLRQEFVSGISDYRLAQRLTVLANEIDRESNQKPNAMQTIDFTSIINGNIQKLEKKLDLSNSGFSGFQSEFELLAECKHLEVLDLRGNDMQEFPAYLLDRLSNLKKLYLQGNPIKNIPREIFDVKNTFLGFEKNVLQDVKNYFRSTTKDRLSTQDQTKNICIIFATLEGYSVNTGNNDLLAKVTAFFFSLKAKYFADEKEHFFKPLGDSILATGHSLVEMAQKALNLRNDIKNYAWKQAGFPENLNVRMALHTGEVIEHYNANGTIRDVLGTAVSQAARLEPYVMVGEVFCSQIHADLLAQDKTHNLATANLGKHNLGKAHDKFELDIAVLFNQTEKSIYERLLIKDCKKHLEEKTKIITIKQSEVSKIYNIGNIEQFEFDDVTIRNDDKILIQKMAKTYAERGEFFFEKGDFNEALVYFGKEADIFEKLCENFPKDVKLKSNLAVAYSKLADTHQHLGQKEATIHFFEMSIQLQKEVYEAFPNDIKFKERLLVTESMLADVLADSFDGIGDFGKILEARKKNLQASQELYDAFPETPKYKNRLAFAYQQLGSMQRGIGQAEEALRSFEKGTTLNEELIDSFPENTQFKNNLAIAYAKLGETHQILEDLEKAKIYFETSLTLLDAMVSRGIDDIDIKNNLAEVHAQLGMYYKETQNVHKAKENYISSKKIWGELYTKFPDNIQFKQKLDAVEYSLQKFAQESEMKPLHQAKMLLIGNPNVGKSSILFRLNDKKTSLPTREATPLIDVQTYTIKDIPVEITNLQTPIDFELKVWDFGGQGKYREIQNLFCTQKSLYVYVTSPDDTEDKEDYIGYEYWLSMAETFGKNVQKNEHGEVTDTHQSPIIHIINKCDMPDFKKGRIAKNLQKYIEKWGDAYLVLSCEKVDYFEEEFDKFEEQIKNILPKIGKDNNDVFNQRYSFSWFSVKEELEKLTTENYISYQRYTEICESNGVSTQTSESNPKSEAQTWLEVLHRIGTVIYFGNNEKLKDWIITNPNWIREAFANVIDAETVQENGGKLTPSLQKSIWKNHIEGLADAQAQKIKDKFIELMLAYEFCYEQNKNYIVPACLPSCVPTFPENLCTFDYEIHLAYAQFLPAGIVNRLMIKNRGLLAQDSEGEALKWKNGFVMRSGNAFAEVTEDWKSKKVIIRIKTNKPTEIFNLLQQQIECFNQEFMNNKFISGLSFETLFQYNGKRYTFQEVEEFDNLKAHFAHVLSSQNQPESSKNIIFDVEKFKKELQLKLDSDRQKAVVDILKKIDDNLAHEQYRRTLWQDISDSIGVMNLAIQQNGLVETTKHLINSIH